MATAPWGALRRWSATEITSAMDPSTGTSQSSRPSGVETGLALR